MGHETPGDHTTVGKAAPPSHPSAKSGPESVHRCPGHKLIREFGLSLASSIPGEGATRLKASTDSWTSAQAVPGTKEPIGKGAPEGTPGCRLSNGSLDSEPSGPGNREKVRSCLSSIPHLETPGKPGMELPETRAQGLTKKRGRDCSLEALSLAPYKKTPKNLGPIWSSSMNRAFCLFPRSLGLGLRGGRPHTFTISINSIESRRSVLWRYPPKGNVWPFIFRFAPEISPVWMSEPSSKISSDIFADLFSCCGIELPFIVVKKLRNFSCNIPGSAWNIFQPMLRNSTPRNMFGIGRIELSPIVRHRTWQTLSGCSETPLADYGDPRTSFGHVSMHLICHGHAKSFHYLCKIQ